MDQLTKHAALRKRQRGFLDRDMELLYTFGRHTNAPGNATEISFGNKEYQKAVAELKRSIQELDRLKGKALVVSDKGKIITCKIQRRK